MSHPTRPLLLGLALVSLASLFVGCSGPRDITVRVSVPDLEGRVVPASGVPVIAVPYNRDSVIRALEAAQSLPRPHTRVLDSLFARFRGPFLDHFRASQHLAAVRDSVEQGALGPEALAPATARTDSTRAALEAVRADLAAADSLRTDVRSWENSTYTSFDSVVKALADQAGRRPEADTTDALGIAEIRLPASNNEWWITARSWDVTDPNNAWTWNVLVEGDSISLDPTNGIRRPRY